MVNFINNQGVGVNLFYGFSTCAPGLVSINFPICTVTFCLNPWNQPIGTFTCESLAGLINILGGLLPQDSNGVKTDSGDVIKIALVNVSSSTLPSQECLDQCKQIAHSVTKEAIHSTCTKTNYPDATERQLCRQGLLSQQYAAISECLSSTCYY